MAQAAAITINDGQGTPVAVTFSPESISPQASIFTDRTSGVAVGFRRLAVSSKFASVKGGVNRGKFTVEYPVTAVVNGVTTVAYTLRASVDVIIPDGASTTERNNLYAFLQNGLANTLVRGGLRDLDPIY